MSDRLNRIASRVTIATAERPFSLDSGRTLAPVQIAYETYGRINERGDNVILVCHALTGSSHAAGSIDGGARGWWDPLIGPGRALDTDRYHVICTNVLGGCHGSTGPTSLDAGRGVPYGVAFPAITVRDMVRAQRLVLDELGVTRLTAVIGGSMGGMQVLEWGALHPALVDRIIPIATSARQSPWCIGFNAVAREAIALGRAAGDEAAGLRLARSIGMLSYRSPGELDRRFGRARADDGAFAVESWLEQHGHRLVARFDAATYETLTRAMDLFDLGVGRAPIDQVLAGIDIPTLVIGISSDVRYPVAEQKALAALLPRGAYREIDSICGHDAFLIEYDQLTAAIAPFLATSRSLTIDASSALVADGITITNLN